ncbi:MAG: zf-HC2 domain-containing protein [Candidatus Tectomicrobia bacterium]|uniref:Zf-HC2 domain-containing protein n=1 Tax=Tectimicrobiota bacterium TaxID=2528274 RepID=A0A932M0Y9_UNCTE|nr:zf-HC2 domain-containing protein [Candidatus Tectomicrobia bacterium]
MDEGCRKLFERMSEYLDGELDLKELADIESHLHLCHHCEACLAALRRTIEVCRSHSVPSMPTEVRRELHELIRKNLS